MLEELRPLPCQHKCDCFAVSATGPLMRKVLFCRNPFCRRSAHAPARVLTETASGNMLLQVSALHAHVISIVGGDDVSGLEAYVAFAAKRTCPLQATLKTWWWLVPPGLVPKQLGVTRKEKQATQYGNIPTGVRSTGRFPRLSRLLLGLVSWRCPRISADGSDNGPRRNGIGG